jgi:hypothetical protein
MGSHIEEFFGYHASDQSIQATESRQRADCPFLGDTCSKRLRDGTVSGVCSLKPATSEPVICCPIRLYADNYRILQDIADLVFGPGLPLEAGAAATNIARRSGSPAIAVFGKRWGGELRLPQRGGLGGYFVDWILAHVDARGVLRDFVAVEVQSIDTTGNYRAERDALLQGTQAPVSTAGLNWENVSKRILPQIIYKGHVLRREPLCTKGLFFVCPTPVYSRILGRLGGSLLPYTLQPGSLTFRCYDAESSGVAGQPRRLLHNGEQFTTTIDQIALAFTAPSNLPPAKVYEQAIQVGLSGQ